jgi:hypothetical protein
VSNEFVELPSEQATVAYYLTVDNCRRLSNGYLGSVFEEAKVSVGHCSRFAQGLNSLFLVLSSYLRSAWDVLLISFIMFISSYFCVFTSANFCGSIDHSCILG